MADMMTFPDTVEEFMEQYKITDTEQIYTNGAELVPIFRMRQWFEHEKAQLFQEGTTKDTTTDVISRQAAIDAVNSIDNLDAKAQGGICFKLMGLPSAQPEERTDKRTEMHACDSISRQDAIDALKICDNNEDGINCYKCPIREEKRNE